jgi:CHAD domain-containing protein
MKKGKLAWDPQALATENAARMLPDLARRFLSMGDKAARPKTSQTRLHEFRLEAKTLRYTLEAFVPLYGPTLGRYVTRVRGVQQTLGQLNDCRTAEEILKRHGAASNAAAVEWLRRIERRGLSRRQNFLQLWREEFAPIEKREQWLRYLRSYAGRRGALLESK